VQRSLVVYDGSNPVFRAAADRLAARADDVSAVPWAAPPVQAFLSAQFDDRPFALLAVDGDTVYVGDAAVEWLLERADATDPVVAAASCAYATGGAALGRVLHGRTVADLDGRFELDEAAAAHLASLRRTHEIPVREAAEDA